MVTTAQIPGSETAGVAEWKLPAAGPAGRAEAGASAAEGAPPLPSPGHLDVAALAHRLRNPLAAIHQSVETLGRCLGAGSPESELCEIALEETRRLERTVSRALCGSTRGLERRCVPVESLVRRVADLISLDPRIRQGIELQLRVDDPGLEAHLDPDRVSEALWSLVENALDAVSTGGQIAIAIAAQHSLGVPGVRIDVRDSGAGFDERGGALRFASTSPLGIGIGLRIAREAALAHGGFLRLRNADEGGARVSLWLPLEPVGR